MTDPKDLEKEITKLQKKIERLRNKKAVIERPLIGFKLKVDKRK